MGVQPVAHFSPVPINFTFPECPPKNKGKKELPACEYNKNRPPVNKKRADRL